MLECVANVSEGRREDVLAELAAACGPALLDVHADVDHHRSVFTLAGPEVEEAALALARVALARIDITDHRGVHPRLGAVDVVPFVALGGERGAAAVAAARHWAASVAAELAVPVFLYGEADPAGRSLPETRREAFTTRGPDFGPDVPHPRFGAVAVGARPVLVAVNCELEGLELEEAGRLAGEVRERNGGMPGVRALAFPLSSRGRVQVSMNLVDLAATGMEAACEAVRQLAREAGGEVAAVELVGLAPASELERLSHGFLAWSGIDPGRSIEARLAAAGLTSGG
jgi:glutamate formiminotransferase / 5-formyltetrahydrofolate cyclo-ligase